MITRKGRWAELKGTKDKTCSDQGDKGEPAVIWKRFPIFSLTLFFLLSPLRLSNPFPFTLLFDLVMAQSHQADGSYILYSVFHMRERVIKKSLLKINEALWRQTQMMVEAEPSLAIVTGISNLIWRKSVCVSVSVCLWFEAAVAWNYGLPFFHVLLLQRLSQIKSSVGVDCSPPHY